MDNVHNSVHKSFLSDLITYFMWITIVVILSLMCCNIDSFNIFVQIAHRLIVNSTLSLKAIF